MLCFSGNELFILQLSTCRLGGGGWGRGTGGPGHSSGSAGWPAALSSWTNSHLTGFKPQNPQSTPPHVAWCVSMCVSRWFRWDCWRSAEVLCCLGRFGLAWGAWKRKAASSSSPSLVRLSCCFRAEPKLDADEQQDLGSKIVPNTTTWH